MPKKPMDYSKTIIYKLVCNDLNVTDLYVGHTTDFKSRKATHKSSVENINHKDYNSKKSTFIRERGGFDNWSMIQIELYPCNDVHEACARERYWYEILGGTLNSSVPSRSKKEYAEVNKEYLLKKHKEYRDEHKEQLSNHKKEYYKENKTTLKKRRMEYYEQNKDTICECECGSTFIQVNKYCHLKTLKHCRFLESNSI